MYSFLITQTGNATVLSIHILNATNQKASAMPDVLKKYPLLRKFLRDRATIGEDMIGPQPLHLADMQAKAFDLIDRHGTGTNAEKEAAMICAACIIEPPALFYNMTALFMDYGPEVEKVIERVVGTPEGMAYDPMLAMARAASGTVIMDDISAKLKSGEPLEGPPQAVLDALKKSFGSDSIAYAALDAPALMGGYEAARDGAYAALKAKVDENRPRFKPKGNNFDF